MLIVIVLLVAAALLVGLGTFLMKIAFQKYQDFKRIQKEEAALEKAKAISLPNMKINLFLEHMFTEYRLPLKLYTLEIQNLNKDSAPVIDFRIEFAFEHNIVETMQDVVIPIGGVSVRAMLQGEIKDGKLSTTYEEQPRETPESKYFSLSIEKAKLAGALANTHIVIFNCEKWPKGALYIGKIVVDLSTKLPSVLKKPYLIGKYEGEYSYEIMGRRFSNKVGGNITLPNKKEVMKQ